MQPGQSSSCQAGKGCCSSPCPNRLRFRVLGDVGFWGLEVSGFGGFRGLGFSGFGGLGFRVLGLRGFRGLGIEGLGC